MNTKSIRKKIKYTSLYAFIQFLFILANALPRSWTLSIYKNLGLLAHSLFKQQRKLIRQHYNYAYDTQMSQEEATSFSKKLFANISKNVGDIFIARSFKDSQKLEEWVEFEGLHHLDNAYKKGKGVIALSCHMGAFELIANILSNRYSTNIIGKKLHNPMMNKLVVDYRSQHGGKVLYSGEGMLKVVRQLHKGELVAILIDQDIPKMKGTFVDFYGKPAYTPIGAAWLATRTEASVVPISIRRTKDNRHIFTALPELEVIRHPDTEYELQQNTQNFTTALESMIRKDPSQWVWMHKRWKTQPKEVLVS